MSLVLDEAINKCTGCGACYNICPVNAVDIKLDENGFLKANIRENACIKCDLCKKVCPVLQPQFKNYEQPECYAVWASDEVRENSSSGGAFTPLAEYVLDHGGAVVGAAWTPDFYVEHIVICDKKDIKRLNRSKYVQSNTKDTFKQTKKLLDENITVLYSGCPCQIAGLKNYLNKEYKNLITIDLLCSHVPPVTLFRQYLDENYGLDNVASFSFRDKSHGWNGDYQRIILKNGDQIINCAKDDYWQKAYHPKLMESEICVECKFARLPRQADLTIGDFWRIGNYDSSWDDRRGTSLVLVNNSKGAELLKTIWNKYTRIEARPKEWTHPNRIQGRNPSNPAHERFIQLLKIKPFNEAVNYALNKKFDIGLVGVWMVKNYGNNLTYYALYKTLEDMGLSVLLIERALDAPVPPEGTTLPLLKSAPIPSFALSKLYPDKIAMKELNQQCDTFLVGSDQLLSNYLYKRFGGHINLSWVYDYKKKIAYAVSLGHNSSKGAKVDRENKAYFFRKFDAFSMREESGCTIVKDQYNVDATPVLDPVFICDKKYFDDLASKAEFRFDFQYIGGYILDPDHKKQQIIHWIENKLNVKSKIISDAEYSQEVLLDKWDVETLTGASCEDWLSIVKNCCFFITDSFHGMCFALIYKKPFIVIDNEKRGSARFLSLLNKVGLQNHIVSSLNFIKSHESILDPIDYSIVDQILYKEKVASFDWLKQAIGVQIYPYKAASTYDILDSRCDFLRQQYVDLLARYHSLEIRLQMLENRPDKSSGVHKLSKIQIQCQKVNGGILCLKDHGLIYTIKYGINKIKRLFSNKNEDLIHGNK